MENHCDPVLLKGRHPYSRVLRTTERTGEWVRGPDTINTQGEGYVSDHSNGTNLFLRGSRGTY
jgi:hypothetical protein